MLRIGIIGVGKWGLNHLRVISKAPCRLVGIADNDGRKKSAAEDYGIHFKRDFRELLPLVDAVIVATPASTHFEIASICLREKKHLLVEKPLALSLLHAQELVSLANQSNLVLSVGHLYRLNPAVIRLKNELRSLGSLEYARLRYLNLNPKTPDDCGVIFDYGSHLVDIAQFLLEKDPYSVLCTTSHGLELEKEESAFIALDYGDFTATFELSWLQPERKIRDAYFVGSEGTIYADFLDQAVTRCDPRGIALRKSSDVCADIHIDYKEPLREELLHFIDCIESEVKPINNSAEACRVVRLCELALKSNQTGRKLRV